MDRQTDDPSARIVLRQPGRLWRRTGRARQLWVVGLLPLCLGCSMQDFGGGLSSLTDIGDSGKSYIERRDKMRAALRAEQLGQVLSEWRQKSSQADIDYTLGPADVLTVGVMSLDQPGEMSTFRRAVDKAGNISLPLIGDLQVQGLPAGGVRAAATQAYAGGFLKDPEVTVDIEAYRSRPVVVNGAVGQPGVVFLDRNSSTVLEVLSMVRGLAPNAGDELIIVRDPDAARANAMPPPEVLNPDAALPVLAGPDATEAARRHKATGGDTPSTAPGSPPAPDVLTGTNDLPMAASATNGANTELKSPSFFARLFSRKARAAPAAETKTVALSTNATPTAAAPAEDDEGEDREPAVSDGERDSAVVDLKRLLEAGDMRLNIPIYGGDILTIPLRKARYVFVMGYVQQAGAYEINPGSESMRALHAITRAGGLAAAARAQKCVVIREGRPPTKVNLAKVSRGVRPPVFLEPGDTLVVGSSWFAKLGEFVKPTVSAGASLSPAP